MRSSPPENRPLRSPVAGEVQQIERLGVARRIGEFDPISGERATPTTWAEGGSTDPPFRVFLDFDGTLLENNMAIQLVEAFCREGAAIARSIDRRLASGEITLRQAWAEEVALLPADRTEEMVAYAVREGKFRRGATTFCDLLSLSRIPAAVVSGGLDFYIRPILEDAGLDLPIYSDTLGFGGDGRLELRHPHGHPTCRLCGICKAATVRGSLGTGRPNVFVGDGSTDRFAAEVADVVFARDRLRGYCSSFGIPHIPFEDFTTIASQLRSWLSGKEPFPGVRAVGRSTSLCPISRSLVSENPALSGPVVNLHPEPLAQG